MLRLHSAQKSATCLAVARTASPTATDVILSRAAASSAAAASSFFRASSSVTDELAGPPSSPGLYARPSASALSFAALIARSFSAFNFFSLARASDSLAFSASRVASSSALLPSALASSR